MIAKHIVEINQVTVYTDFSLFDNGDDMFDKFITELESVPGVDKLTVGRYRVEAMVGPLFDNIEVLDQVEVVFRQNFDIDVWAPYDVEDLKTKISKITKRLTAHTHLDALLEMGKGFEEA